MLAHDSVADAQAKSGTFAYIFCGVKRIENAIRIADPGSVIRKPHFDRARRGFGGNNDFSRLWVSHTASHALFRMFRNTCCNWCPLATISGSLESKCSVTSIPRLLMS